MEGKNKVQPAQRLAETVKKGLAYYPITFYVGLLLFALAGTFLYLHLRFHYMVSLLSVYYWIQLNATTLLIIATMLLSVVLVTSGMAYRQVSKLSKEDYAIWLQQKSTRTLFPFFTPIHDWLRMRVTIYRWWHTRTYASPIHSIILVIFILFMFHQVTSSQPSALVSPEGSGNYYWTANSFQAAWSTTTSTTKLNDVGAGDTTTYIGGPAPQLTAFYDNGSAATMTGYNFTSVNIPGNCTYFALDGSLATGSGWTSIETGTNGDCGGVATYTSGTLNVSYRYFKLSIMDQGMQSGGEFLGDWRLTLAAPPAASTLKVGLGDQFTTSVDAAKWNANNSASSTDTIVSSKLKALATTTASSFAGVNSNTKLMMRGDFDVQVDFDDTSMPTPAAGTCADTTFQVNGATYTYEILNRKASDGTFAITNWGTQTSSGTGNATGAPSGKMRIVRTGTSITTWYATTTGAWVQIAGSFTSVDSGDMYVTLVANNNCGATGIAPLAYFDNFIISKGYLATKNVAFDTVVEALDSTGAAVYTGYTGTVAFTSNDGSATKPSNYAFQAGDNGIHTFATGVTLQTVASSKTVTATDTVTGTITGVGTFGVMGPATVYAITGTPANATAGTAFNVTVTAKDSAGNVATGYTGIAHFTSTDGAATLPADYTFVSGDKGVHTFSINLKTAGSKTFTATDTVTGTITATSSAVTVANASYTVNPNIGSTASIALDAVSSPGNKGGVNGCQYDVVTATITIGSGTNRVLLLGANGAIGAASTLISADLDGVALTKYATQAVGASFQQDVWYLKNPATGAHTITAYYDDTAGCLPAVYYNIAAMSFTGVDQTTTIEAGHASLDASGNATTATDAVTTLSANAWIADFLLYTSGSTATPTAPLTTQVTGPAGITERGATKGPVVSPAATTQTWALGAAGIYGMEDVVLKPASTTSTVTSSTAGSGFNLTVTEKDGTGATNTGYRGTVHFTSSDPLAVLPADYAFLAGDNGVHTFTNAATLKTFGPQTITATDTVTGTTVGVSSVVMVNGTTAATMAVKYNNSDTFDSAIDSNKWVAGGTQSPTISTGRLKALATTATNSSSTANTSGKSVLHGDFDVQVDYDSASQPTPAAATYEKTILQVVGGTYNYQIYSAKGNNGATSVDNWSSRTNGAFGTYSQPATTTSGKFRIARIGAVVNTYYWSGSAWTFMGSEASSDTSDMYVNLQSWNNGATTTAALAYFDNFIINSGQANTSVNAGTATTATVSAIDTYGNIALGYTGIAHFTSTDGAATLPSNYTFVTLDAGVHAFITPVFNTAGTKTITATDTVTGTITGTSGNMTVNAVVGPVNHFALTSTPTTATAGTAFSTTVTAQDASNQTVTGYTGTVHFTSTDAYPAVLPADYTFVGGDSGVHTFTNAITMKTAGSKTFTVTDTGNGAVTVTSAAITVSPATVNNLTMTSTPTTATAGTAFSSTVTAKDAYNNTVTTYVGTVAFTSTDGAAVLPANYTYVGGDNGAHTFTNAITLKTAGSKTFTLTDSGNSVSVTSAAITVSAASAATLTVTGLTSPVTAGTASDVIVTAKDAYANTATGYTGTIHFTSTDSFPAVVPSNYTFVGGDNGVHTFTGGVTFKTVGTRTVSATDINTGSITGNSSNVTVNPATAASLTVTGLTSPVTAGTASNVTVTAYDAYGNVATGYTGIAHFTSTDGAALLPSNYTFVGGDNGAHTFTNGATLKTVGSKTVTATDTITGSITGTSSSITVNPSTATTYVWSSVPGSETAGTTFTMTLTAKDAYSNTATGYAGTAHFTSSDLQVVVPSDYIFVPGDNGAHTFTNGFTLKTAGSKTITATDTITGSITSTTAGITVNNAAISTLSFSAEPPSTRTAGQTFNVSVSPLDAYGNIATGYTGTLHFTSNDSQAQLPTDYTVLAGNSGPLVFGNLIYKTSGSHTVTVSDGTRSATTTTTAVSAASASSITMTGVPGATNSGDYFSPVVTAHDTYSNVATGYTGTIHFTSSDGTATLPSNYTFVGGDNGAHTFTGEVALRTTGSQSVTVTDIGNGSLTSTENSTVSSTAASQLVISNTASNATAGTAFSATITMKDAQGNTATGYTGTIHFTSNDSQAVLPSNYTFVGGDNGTHTFTNAINLKTAGSKNFTATDISDGTLTSTANVTVSPASSIQMVFSTVVSTSAGSPFDATLTAKDTYNNVITDFAGTIYFSSSDSHATLPANYAYLPGDNGAHTFTNGFTLETSGSQGVTVAGVGVNSSSVTITVNPSYTTTLTMSLPSPVTAGIATSATITAKDQYGNTTPTFTDTIHFTSSDGAATLPADYTFVGGDAGVHAFTNGITFMTGGLRSLTATDNDDGSIFVSANTTVNPGAATQLVVTSTPASVTAGSAFSTTISAKDAGGNTVTGYTGTVHFTSSDSQSTLAGNYTFVGGDNGTHTFANGVTLKTAGSQSFTVAETSPGALSVTTNITVNAAAATRLIMSTSPAGTVTAGSAFTATVTARDAYNNTATGYTGSVAFISSDSQATLPVNYNFVSGDAGRHTFSNIYLKTAGTKSLTATDIGNGSLSVTLNLTVGSSTATQLVFGSVPVSSTAADQISITALARDAYNNTATGYTGTIHFSSSDPQATLPTDYVFVGGDAGSHTFSSSIVLKSGGVQTLTISDTNTPAMSQTASITISSAPSAQMQMSTVVSAAAGTPFATTITMRDSFGNIVTNYTGTVHFSSSDGSATLPSNYTFVPGDLGSHTFSGLVFKTAGTQTLSANELSGSLSVSASIVVNSGAASQIVMSGLPSSSAAGSSFGATLTVKDSSGNVVTGYTGTVRFSSSDSQAILPGNYAFVGGDNGTHAFTGIILKKSGSVTLTATDTNGSPVGNGTVSVTPGAINGYNVTGTSPQTVGTGWSETVTGLDVYGNQVSDSSTVVTMTGDNVGVTFYSNSSHSTQTTTYTLSAGRATIYLDANASGSVTLTATDSSGKKGVSGTITINAAPVTPPSGTGTTTTTTTQTTQPSTNETGGKVAIFRSNPAVQKAADTTSIVSSAVAIASFAPAASAVTTAITTSMLQGVSIFNLPFLGLARRKNKKRWGTVKNTLTGLPIAGVFVELWSLEKPVLLGKTLTDSSGQFAFLVDKPGQFYLRVDNPLYEAWHSLPIVVTNPKEDIIKTEAALQPIESILQNRLRRAQKLIKATEFLYYLHWPLLIAGTFLAALTLYDKVTTGRIIMACVYGGMWLMKILESKYERPFGVVSDSATERPQPLSVVQLTKQNADGPEVVRSTITDSKGRFMFVVKPSKYNLTAAKNGFVPENKEVTGQKVNMDVKLKWNEQDKP